MVQAVGTLINYNTVGWYRQWTNTVYCIVPKVFAVNSNLVR
jgi:hypothetical protein